MSPRNPAQTSLSSTEIESSLALKQYAAPMLGDVLQPFRGPLIQPSTQLGLAGKADFRRAYRPASPSLAWAQDEIYRTPNR